MLGAWQAHAICLLGPWSMGHALDAGHGNRMLGTSVGGHKSPHPEASGCFALADLATSSRGALDADGNRGGSRGAAWCGGEGGVGGVGHTGWGWGPVGGRVGVGVGVGGWVGGWVGVWG